MDSEESSGELEQESFADITRANLESDNKGLRKLRPAISNVTIAVIIGAIILVILIITLIFIWNSFAASDARDLFRGIRNFLTQSKS